MLFRHPLVVNTEDWQPGLFDVDEFLMKPLGDYRVDLLEIKISQWNNFLSSVVPFITIVCLHCRY